MWWIQDEKMQIRDVAGLDLERATSGSSTRGLKRAIASS